MARPIRVLVADDHREVRSAIRLILAQEADVEVAAEATDRMMLLPELADCCPDLLLLDWELPEGKSDEAAHLRNESLPRAIRAVCCGVKIVALSGRPEAREAALAAGVDAFVSKGDPPESLISTLLAIGRGRDSD